MKKEARTEKYAREQEILSTRKMRDVLDELPRFCRQYFRGIEGTTGARTRLGYAYDLRIFFEFLQKENPSLRDLQIREFPFQVLERIGKEDIEEFLEYLSFYEKDGQTFTNDERGKARKLSAVRSMFKYFYTSEMLEKDVSALVPLPKLHEKPIVRMDAEEVARMLDKADSGADLTKNQLRFHEKTRVRDVALLTLLLGTGIRVSECVGLDLDDLDFKDKGLRVHRKGGYDSIVYFGDEVEEALLAWLEERRQILPREGHEKALFLSLQNRRITVRAVENLVRKYAGLATALKKITPHKLRSTYGTSLYRATGDIYLVADVLGHKDVNTTRKHYAAVEEDRRRSARNIVQLHRGAAEKSAGPADAGQPEAILPDAGPPDVGSPDAGPPDAGSADAGFPDAGSPDTELPDMGSTELSKGHPADLSAEHSTEYSSEQSTEQSTEQSSEQSSEQSTE